MNEGALATLDHEAALKEIANGTIAREIGERYGVTGEAVRKALRKARPEQYKEAVSDQVEHWVFDSADEMNSLPADAVCIARARARADFRLKLASKLNPAYADKQQIDINQTVKVEHTLKTDASELLASISGSVIEGEVIAPHLLQDSITHNDDVKS